MRAACMNSVKSWKLPFWLCRLLRHPFLVLPKGQDPRWRCEGCGTAYNLDMKIAKPVVKDSLTTESMPVSTADVPRKGNA